MKLKHLAIIAALLVAAFDSLECRAQFKEAAFNQQ